MDETELLQRLALALAIGFVTGVERGWRQRGEPSGARVAGIRTFALIGLLGGIAGALGLLLGDLFVGFAFAGLAALLVMARIARMRAQPDYGLTTDVAALITFALGVLAVRGEMAIAAAAGAVTVTLLDVKERLHGWLERIEGEEIRAAIRLLLISVVVLPFLPDRGMGPGAVLNPYALWWMVVLIAGIGFAGHTAVRLAGTRLGLLATGLFAGLASSTALTVSLARIARREPDAAAALAPGVGAASAVMFLRTLGVLAVINLALAERLLLPFGGAALMALLVSLLLARRHMAADPSGTLDLGPPLDLSLAMLFGAILALVTLLVYWLQTTWGTPGLYGLALLSGLVDVDAITLSTARADLPLPVAAVTISIVSFVNTVFKIALAGIFGTPAFARAVLPPLGAALLAGAAGLGLQSL